MKVNTKEFLSALKVLDLVPVRSGIPSSEFIRMQGFPMYTKNANDGIVMALAAEISGAVIVKLSDGFWDLKESFFVDRKVLMPFVAASRSPEITITTGKSLGYKQESDDALKIVLKSGRRTLTLANGTLSAGYVEPPNAKVRRIKISDELRELITLAQSFGPAANVLPQLESVFISQNGKVLSSCDIVIFQGNFEFLNNGVESFHIPLASVPLLASALKEIKLTKQAFILEFTCGTLMQAMPTRVLKEFPVKRMVQCVKDGDKVPKRVTFSPGKLLAIYDRFGKYLASAKDKVLKIKGTQADGVVKIKAESGTAVFSETLSKGVKILKDFEFELPMDMTSKFIQYAAGKNQGITVAFSDKSPYYLLTKRVTLVCARKVS
jgi:hypothetical protein